MKRFTRVIEDFRCENCGAMVKGSGYTNHCPYCLFSKHVDINPGDRAAPCEGLMAPVAIEQRRSQLRVRHRCLRCGFERVNRLNSTEMSAAIELAKQLALDLSR